MISNVCIKTSRMKIIEINKFLKSELINAIKTTEKAIIILNRISSLRILVSTKLFIPPLTANIL